MNTVLFGSTNRNFKISNIVNCIIRRVIFHAVGSKSFGCKLYNVVCEKLKGKQALATRMNDQRGFFDPTVQYPHALPWILFQISHTNVKYCTTDKIDCLESSSIQ